MRRNKIRSLAYVIVLAFVLTAFAIPRQGLSSQALVSGNATRMSQIDPIRSSGNLSASQTSSSTDLKGSWVWLWENYSSGLQAIQEHPGALTVVSPNTYSLLNNGTFGTQSTEAEICPQVHALGLQCIPLIQNDQSNPTGINTLLTSESLQFRFIQNAVSEAINSNVDGYNVDFEPSSGIQNLAIQYGVFLTNFANAMHAQGKTLSVDIASWDNGAFWNYTIEAQSSADLILTMVTYDSNFATFQSGLQAMLTNVPLNKIAIGLLTATDDSNLTERFQEIKANNIQCVMVWPSYPGFLTQMYWDNLTAFLQS